MHGLQVIAYLQVVVYRDAVKLGRSSAQAVQLPGVQRDYWGTNDLSDIQWRDFRGSLPKLFVALGIFALASQAVCIFVRCFHLNGKSVPCYPPHIWTTKIVNII